MFCNSIAQIMSVPKGGTTSVLLLKAVKVELRNQAWITIFHCFPSDGFQSILRVGHMSDD
jgi:hypothetical protein